MTTRKTNKAKSKAPATVMPTPESLGELGRWCVKQHTELMVLGDHVDGMRTTVLNLWASSNQDGRVGYMCSLDVRGRDAAAVLTWGPNWFDAPGLAEARVGALKWAHGIIGSVARDLNLAIGGGE